MGRGYTSGEDVVGGVLASVVGKLQDEGSRRHEESVGSCDQDLRCVVVKVGAKVCSSESLCVSDYIQRLDILVVLDA